MAYLRGGGYNNEGACALCQVNFPANINTADYRETLCCEMVFHRECIKTYIKSKGKSSPIIKCPSCSRPWTDKKHIFLNQLAGLLRKKIYVSPLIPKVQPQPRQLIVNAVIDCILAHYGGRKSKYGRESIWNLHAEKDAWRKFGIDNEEILNDFTMECYYNTSNLECGVFFRSVKNDQEVYLFASLTADFKKELLINKVDFELWNQNLIAYYGEYISKWVDPYDDRDVIYKRVKR